MFILAIWRKNEKLLLLLLLLLSFTRTHPHTHVSCLFDSNDPNLYLFSLFDWLFIWKMVKLVHLLNLSLIRFKRILFFPTRFFTTIFFSLILLIDAYENKQQKKDTLAFNPSPGKHVSVNYNKLLFVSL